MSAGETVVYRLRLDRCPDPLQAYAALTAEGTRPGTALLESADTGHTGSRRSLLVLAPALRIASTGERPPHIDAHGPNGRAARERLDGAGGNPPRGFDALRLAVDILRPRRPEDHSCLMLVGATTFEPGYLFVLPELVLDIDPLRGRAELIALAFEPRAGNDLARRVARLADLCAALGPAVSGEGVADVDVADAQASCDDASFCRRVEQGRELVRAGEVFQIVLSRHWTLPCAQPLAAYRRLRRDNPSPYLFYLRDTSRTLFGASPESALRFDAAGRRLQIYPVAGTRPRGTEADQDARLEAELRQDPKELAEHMMLVDLARNDIARVCEPGSRGVPLLLGVDRYAHVMHLVSRVEGRLRAGLDALHALEACLNMGTLTGAPKRRATELISEIERTPRGFYGGAVGLFDGAGNLDTAITIRAAVVRNGRARVQAGAGIVLDSDPQREADETRAKASAVLRAIAEAPA